MAATKVKALEVAFAFVSLKVACFSLDGLCLLMGLGGLCLLLGVCGDFI